MSEAHCRSLYDVSCFLDAAKSAGGVSLEQQYATTLPSVVYYELQYPDPTNVPTIGHHYFMSVLYSYCSREGSD